MYTSAKVTVFDDQHDKLKKAIAHQKSISIKLNLDHSGGEHMLLLTGGQIARIERSKMIGKGQVTLHLSKKQVQANVQYRGGFLHMLAGLAAKAPPSLLRGLVTGLVSGAVERAVGCSGFYLVGTLCQD